MILKIFKKKLRNYSNYFSSLSLNIRSLTGKLNEFHELINELNHNKFMFSIIWIQETWNIPVNLNTDIPGYQPLIYKTRKPSDKCRNNIGGGIGCWIRDINEYETLDKV